ncbi:MAG: Rieske 2Fe-2S domain-containing protein [Gammaproteobacteria bacterium]
MIPYHYIRNTWYVIGFSHEFGTEQLNGLTVAGRPIVVWRTAEGKVVAFDNRCAHKRMPLSEGRIMPDGTLECAYHGLCYNDAGQCVTVPAHPDGFVPPQAKLRPFPLIEQDNVVWLWPGDPQRASEARPPRTPEFADDEWESIGSEPMHVPANYLLLIENLLDISHFYPLHDGNIGDAANSRIPVEMVEGEEQGNRFVKTIRKVQNYEQPPFLADWFVYDVVDREHTHCMVCPGLTRVEMHVAPPGQLGTDAERGYVLCHTHTPVDEKNHIWRWRVSCKADHMSKGDPSKSAARRVVEMFPAVVEEDLWALEKQQQMFDYPDEGYTEVYLRPDKALRRIRQIFAAAQRAESQTAEQAVPLSRVAAEQDLL